MTKEYKPEWVKNLEDWGKKTEEKFDKAECNADDKKIHKKPAWEKNTESIGDLFGQFICYLLITYIPPRFPGFFLSGWSAVYTVALCVIVINVIVDIITLLIKAKPIYYLGQVVTNAASVVSMIVVVSIFPFNFPGNIGVIVQFALWIAIVVVFIVTFFDFFKIFTLVKE